MASPDDQSPPLGDPLFEEGIATLAPYLLVEPFVAGRAVLDLEPTSTSGHDRLRVAGRAGRVQTAGLGAHVFDEPNASYDVVLALAGAGGDAESRARLVGAMKRVLRDDGFAVIRVAAKGGGFGGDSTTRMMRAELEAALRPFFRRVDVVAQVPFVGYQFAVPRVFEVAVNEDLFPPAAPPAYHVAFCTDATTPAYTLTESLLVPVARPRPMETLGLSPDVQALVRERDALRERLMTLDDQRERLERSVVGLRREADRLLARLTEREASLELENLGREQAERRAAALEEALATLRAALRSEDTGVRERVLREDQGPAATTRPTAPA